METRRLGDSDLDVTRIIFGAWAIGGSMWGGQDDTDSIGAIHASLDAGVNVIDTAPLYGRGKSEELLGRALEGRRDQVIIASKCGLIWDRPHEGNRRFDMIEVDGSAHPVHHDMSPAAVRRGCEESLARLRTDRIDLMQIHWPDPSMQTDDMFGELLNLREEGKVRWLGVCNFSPEQLAVAKRVAGIVSDQPQYSLVERGIEAGVLPWCRAEGVGVVCYSPMGRGLLSGKYAATHTFPPNDHRSGVRSFQPDVRPRVLAGLEQAREMAAAYRCTLANLAVAWTLAQPGVTAAIVGARNAAQARENAAAAGVKLSPSDAQQLAAWLAI